MIANRYWIEFYVILKRITFNLVNTAETHETIQGKSLTTHVYTKAITVMSRQSLVDVCFAAVLQEASPLAASTFFEAALLGYSLPGGFIFLRNFLTRIWFATCPEMLLLCQVLKHTAKRNISAISICKFKQMMWIILGVRSLTPNIHVGQICLQRPAMR